LHPPTCHALRRRAAGLADVLFASDDLEQATMDALHALGHLGLMAGASGQVRFEAAVERSLSMLLDTVQIDLSLIGDTAESAFMGLRPPR
jgi:hypothetical protein